MNNSILQNLIATKCKRCGNYRKIGFLTRLVLLWKINQMRRKRLDDSHIRTYLNNLLSALCNE